MSEVSFSSRVNEFWKWYAGVAQRFFDVIEDGKCADLLDEVGPKVGQLFPGFAWLFGPGPDDVGGHAFTLSGGGNLSYQFLAEYWLAHAPALPGWTFYSCRQPNGISPETAFGFGDSKFTFGETSFTYAVSEQSENIELNLYNPGFAQVDENVRMEISFLILDEILGEFGTEQWIGPLHAVVERPENSISIMRLRDELHDLEIKYNWKKLPPTQSACVYQCDGKDDFPRGDTLFGSTIHINLINDFLSSSGEMKNPIPNTGADFVYAQFSSSVIPEGSEVEFRSGIEDAIDQRLTEANIGRSLGGALGHTNTYIEFLLTDTQHGLEVICDELVQRQLPVSSEIHFFAVEKRDRSIVVRP